MSKLTFTNDSAKWFAGVMAIFATVVAIGGPLSLAEHYARTGAAATMPSATLVQQQSQLICRNT
jgi:hypothetical protein